jgi:peptide/nickel transport system permease protein
VPVVLAVSSTVVFLLPQLTGIHTAGAVLRARGTESTPDPATVARVTHEFGLDRPLAAQYLSWLRHAVTGPVPVPRSAQVAAAARVSRR